MQEMARASLMQLPAQAHRTEIDEVAALWEGGRDAPQRRNSAHSSTAGTAAKTRHSASRSQTAGRVENRLCAAKRIPVRYLPLVLPAVAGSFKLVSMNEGMD